MFATPLPPAPAPPAGADAATVLLSASPMSPTGDGVSSPSDSGSDGGGDDDDDDDFGMPLPGAPDGAAAASDIPTTPHTPAAMREFFSKQADKMNTLERERPAASGLFASHL